MCAHKTVHIVWKWSFEYPHKTIHRVRKRGLCLRSEQLYFPLETILRAYHNLGDFREGALQSGNGVLCAHTNSPYGLETVICVRSQNTPYGSETGVLRTVQKRHVMCAKKTVHMVRKRCFVCANKMMLTLAHAGERYYS